MDNEASKKALKHILADTYVLTLLTQNAHWNMEGPSFIGLHKLFEEQYTEMIAAIDEIAERIRALGGFVEASMQTYIEAARLEEVEVLSEELNALSTLAAGHQRLSVWLKEHIAILEQQQDVATCDLLTARVLYHEKQAWLLKSHLIDD